MSVEKAIEQYTDMMEKSFLKLPSDQKWILVSLLDEQLGNNPNSIAKVYSAISPVPYSKPIDMLLEELDEAFIRIKDISHIGYDVTGSERRIGWVHPSYRDLVIDSLSEDQLMRIRYLEQSGMATYERNLRIMRRKFRLAQ